ncbi:organomercurial lyase [Halobellus rubicundus]|uniref:Organomercurial lyase n=1 Tax=Halobellus rubicundus TaxID=2996466 RepID=A0ABD5M8J9_9EURY
MSDERATDDASIELDQPVRRHAADAFGFDAEPETFGDLWGRMMATFADALGRPARATDLCTTDASPHRAVAGGESQSFRCVTDAFIYAGLRGGDVTVRTVSPLEGRGLSVEYDADGAVNAPDGAVLSFGVERDASPPGGPVTPERMYGRVCPHSKAFVSRDEYERWAAARPEVATQALPLDGALAALARLAGREFGGDGGREPRRGADEGCACVGEVDP